MARLKKERERIEKGLGGRSEDTGESVRATPEGRMPEASRGSFSREGSRSSSPDRGGRPRKARAAQARRRTRQDNPK